MKTKLLGLSILISALFSAQKLDSKMIGCWKGTETDQKIEGMSKYADIKGIYITYLTLVAFEKNLLSY